MDSSNRETALSMKGVSKQFPGTLAVNNVDFEVNAGEVHALVGENGAGKSTLMKILAGLYKDYSGDIEIKGIKQKLHSPAVSKLVGIEMIYQELSLARSLSIADNILVGRLPVKSKVFLDKDKMHKESIECLKNVGLDYIDPDSNVEEISQHEAQLVEIAKALGNKPKILVMDEPTSALSNNEVERLFSIVNKLKTQGIAIVYITHHLSEIFRIADRVTVLRDGIKVDTLKIRDANIEMLIKLMIGNNTKQHLNDRNREYGEVNLEVCNLTRYGFFHNVSFSLRKGEILGLAGLVGAGRTEVGRVISGVDAFDSGNIILNGRKIYSKSMNDAMQSGISYLTENRKTEGLVLRLTMEDNILVPLIPKFCRFLVYQKQNGHKIVQKFIDSLSIRPPLPSKPVRELSGGNQQKVLLAKWLTTEPQVLILDEPTRGVDIGAKMLIHEFIENLATQGIAIILISSDLPEIVRLSDRILVMRKGRIMSEIDKSHCTEESVLMAVNSDVMIKGGGSINAN